MALANETTRRNISSMDDACRQMLERFAESANKTRLGPNDFMRFCELNVYIHRHALMVTGPQIRAFLHRCGFSWDAAMRLSVLYEMY